MYSRADSLGYAAEAATTRKEYRPFRALGVEFLPLLLVGIGITCASKGNSAEKGLQEGVQDSSSRIRMCPRVTCGEDLTWQVCSMA